MAAESVTSLAPFPGLRSVTLLDPLAARAADYATRAHGPGTLRAYRSAWRRFAAWCDSLGRDPLAADARIVMMYAVRCADDGLAFSSLQVHLAAIRTALRLADRSINWDDRELRQVLSGIARTHGTRARRQARPATPALLRPMLAALPPTIRDDGQTDPLAIRNRAMLLLGFAAALRRSELVGLQLGDVVLVPGRGMRLLVRRSKTDQQGRGQDIAVCANPADEPFCPAAALDLWLQHRRAAGDIGGVVSDAERPLFCAVSKDGRLTGAALSDKAVVRLVKQAAAAAGLDPNGFSGHSLRAGLATAAGEAGAGLPELMRQTRHRSTAVALSYLRPTDLWRDNVTARVYSTKTTP